jgi:hypothetical protein
MIADIMIVFCVGIYLWMVIASLVVWADWELRNPLELRDDDPEGWL